MPDDAIRDALRDFARARSRAATEDRAISALRARRTEIAAQLEEAVRAGAQARADSLSNRLTEADETLANRIGVRDGILGDIVDLSAGLTVERTPEQLVATLDGSVPVAMTPVRIETRFDGPTKLRVRVFPDQIHIDAHDPALTADEAEGGRWYWTHRWHAGLDDMDAAREAWDGIVGRFRPGRAAHIVAALTPADASAGGEPVFPEVMLRESAWSRPAVATALPDRFCVVGYSQGADGWVERFRRWGSPVPDRLAVAPDPHAMKEPPAPGRLPVDEGTAWTREPARARDEGMLIEIEHASLAEGVDRLVVLGVDWTLTPEDAAASLDRLLHAQRTAAHLEFVAQGTPTNNTESGPAAYTSDPAAEAALLDPARTPLPVGQAAASGAGALLAGALGLEPGALADVPGADLREQDWASALTDVLWRATAGFYIQDLLDPLGKDASLVKDDPHIDADLREFVARHVLACGPLPTLRVGTQPYGVLPVVASRRYRTNRRTERLVHRVASTIRRILTPVMADIPHLRRAGEDQDVDTVMLALLQRTPVPWSFDFRGLTGPVERKNTGIDWERRHAFQNTWTTLLWSELGVRLSTRLSELTLGDRHRLRVPLVARVGQEPTGYLREIAELTSHPHGRTALNLRENSLTLLEALAAFAALEELDRCTLQHVNEILGISAAELAALPALRNLHIPTPDSVRVEAAPTIEPALLDFRSGRQLAETVVPQVSPTLPLGAVVPAKFAEKLTDIVDLLGAPADPFYWLGRFRMGLDTLSAAPVDQLTWAFRGHLSVYSTRLDAWFTGLASARLADHRARAPRGVHLGCWGFVENLRRDVGAAAESLGFVHTPSQAQAVSAALLRNGRIADRSADGDVFDLQLTSDRVRRARWLLDGIAQGQRLAALLGYRIERRLRDEGLPFMRYQMPLRRVAPLRGEIVAPEEPVEVLAARDVVDGVAILDRWRSNAADAQQKLLKEIAAHAGLAALSSQDAAALRRVLDDVAGDYDSVSDVLIAEAVHQAALGNLERSGAALAAHDRHGRAGELDFASAPRSGHTVAHRVVVVEQPAAGGTGWPRDTRAVAEPLLEAWAARVLGAPADWAFRAVSVAPPADAGGVEVRTELAPVSLDGLGLGALSVALATRRAGASAASELEQRIALAFAGQVPPDPAARLELLAEPPAGTRGGLGLLATLGDWIASIAGSPPATATDFRSADAPDTGDGAAGTVDVAELAQRADAVRLRLEALEEALAQASTPAQRERALLDAVAFDGPDALPRVPRGHPNAALEIEAQVGEVLERVRSLARKASETLAAPLPDDATPAVELLTATLREMLGPAQPVLPRWTFTAPASVSASLAARSTLLRDDAYAPVTWLHRSALVRPDLDPLASILLHREADGADIAESLVLVQQPHRPDAGWHALSFPPDDPPPHGSLGVVVITAAGLRPERPFAGVVVDAWTETIPEATETTAVTFHYDAPGARPPQAVLLAVHPETDPDAWSMDLLLDTVNEAADLARVRMLSSKELSVLGSFLPAVYLPDDYTHDVPSVSLWKLQNTVMDAVAGVLGKQ